MDEMREAHAKRDELRRIAMEQKQGVYIAALSEWGTKKKALEISKIPARTYEKWHARDTDFAKRCEEARFTFAEGLEEIALERVLNPDKGRGSDILLMALLNANMPKKYRPQVQVGDDSSKELLYEWRKATQQIAKQSNDVESSTELSQPMEKTLTEILNNRKSKKSE